MSSAILQALRALDPRLPALDDGRLRLTYGDLQRSVEQESRWLRAQGVQRCAMLADNGAGWVITDLALLASNAIHVPIPTYFTHSQITHLLADAAIDAVLTDRPGRVRDIESSFTVAQRSHRSGFTLLRRHAGTVLGVDVSPLKITYTSGSTGVPRGVVLANAVLERVAASLAQATAGLGIERHMCVLPLPTLLENIAGVYAPILLGAQMHVRASDAIGMSYGRPNAPALLSAIREIAPHSLVLVPELLRILLGAVAQGWAPPPCLKFIAVGGASVSAALLHEARKHGLPVYEGYGLSECASVVCLNTPQHNRLGSVGRPLPHARVRIDSNGEICVAGAVMSGYLGQPACSDEEIRTGDLGEIDADGFVYVRGRAKNMFITSMGRNVTPEWVERELTCEPMVAHAMVSGEARAFPVALISPVTPAVPMQAIEQSVVRANARLPDYAQVRRWALFPESPSFANGLLTSNGRLRRGDIAARHARLLDSLHSHEAEAT